MKKSVILIVFILMMGNVLAVELTKQNCEANGRFEITLEAENKNRTYTDQIEILIDGKIIEGEWDINFIKKDPPDRRRETANFISKEAEVLDGGKKIIKINYPLEFEGVKSTETIQGVLECPDFVFSCVLLDLKVDECYTEDNVFYGYFTAKGFEQNNVKILSLEDNLEFNLHTIEVYHDINDIFSRRGFKPKKAIVKQVEGDKYMMEFKFPSENEVEKFRVAVKDVNQCFTSEYDEYNLKLDDTMECNKGSIEEKPKEEIVEDKKDVEEVIKKEPPVKEENGAIKVLITLIILAIGIGVLFKIKKPKI